MDSIQLKINRLVQGLSAITVIKTCPLYDNKENIIKNRREIIALAQKHGVFPFEIIKISVHQIEFGLAIGKWAVKLWDDVVNGNFLMDNRNKVNILNMLLGFPFLEITELDESLEMIKNNKIS